MPDKDVSAGKVWDVFELIADKLPAKNKAQLLKEMKDPESEASRIYKRIRDVMCSQTLIDWSRFDTDELA